MSATAPASESLARALQGLGPPLLRLISLRAAFVRAGIALLYAGGAVPAPVAGGSASSPERDPTPSADSDHDPNTRRQRRRDPNAGRIGRPPDHFLLDRGTMKDTGSGTSSHETIIEPVTLDPSVSRISPPEVGGVVSPNTAAARGHEIKTTLASNIVPMEGSRDDAPEHAGIEDSPPAVRPIRSSRVSRAQRAFKAGLAGVDPIGPGARAPIIVSPTGRWSRNASLSPLETKGPHRGSTTLMSLRPRPTLVAVFRRVAAVSYLGIAVDPRPALSIETSSRHAVAEVGPPGETASRQPIGWQEGPPVKSEVASHFPVERSMSSGSAYIQPQLESDPATPIDERTLSGSDGDSDERRSSVPPGPWSISDAPRGSLVPMQPADVNTQPGSQETDLVGYTSEGARSRGPASVGTPLPELPRSDLRPAGENEVGTIRNRSFARSDTYGDPPIAPSDERRSPEGAPQDLPDPGVHLDDLLSATAGQPLLNVQGEYIAPSVESGHESTVMPPVARGALSLTDAPQVEAWGTLATARPDSFISLIRCLSESPSVMLALSRPDLPVSMFPDMPRLPAVPSHPLPIPVEPRPAGMTPVRLEADAVEPARSARLKPLDGSLGETSWPADPYYEPGPESADPLRPLREFEAHLEREARRHGYL